MTEPTFESELRELMKKWEVNLVPYEYDDDSGEEGYRFTGKNFSFDVSHLEVSP